LVSISVVLLENEEVTIDGILAYDLEEKNWLKGCFSKMVLFDNKLPYFFLCNFVSFFLVFFLIYLLQAQNYHPLMCLVAHLLISSLLQF
jgi:hypothetical protein